MSAAGLGLQLYDTVNGTSLHEPYDAWADFARRHYMGRDRHGDLDWFAFYYDPVEREAATFPDHLTAFASLCITPYVLPQRREWATWLYERSVHMLGWSNPRARLNQFLPDPRFLSVALLMAHELGDDVTERRLRDHVEQHFEPSEFGPESDRFGFFFGWDEPYPRGQQSALLMVPEVGERGSWSRPFHDAGLDKFDQPTVEGVDFPSVGLSAARNIGRELHLRTYAATPAHRGRSTTMRVTRLPDSSAVRVLHDGHEFGGWQRIDDSTIELTLEIGDQDVVVITELAAAPHHAAATGRREATSQPPDATGVRTATTAGPLAAPSTATIAAVAGCRCC